ncbi:MAG TPA: FmdB family zinc ribbon protein [Phycisphaerae bacterium]|jgi:putative FmdB family regulatory protein|nr:FmdB family zinc ribbon protein [Phycisphaerae bacterium]
MPTYEYACEACGHKFEEFQSITAKPITKCPACGKKKVKRLISAGAGFIFKGSGFYITDYRDENYKNAAKSDAAPAKADAPAKTDGKADAPAKTDAPKTDAAAAKSEAKPAAKPESKTASKSAAKAKR